MLKSVLFTHDDLDGAGCRIIFELAHQHLKKGIDYLVLNCGNGSIDDDVMRTINNDDIDEKTEIWFADIVASREILETLKDKFKSIKIFDHHRTNFFATWVIEDACIIPENNLGKMESGTSLIFQHFVQLGIDNSYNLRAAFTQGNGDRSQLLTLFVDSVRSYDTYEWKETNNLDAKKLQTLFTLLGMDRFCEQYITRLTTGNDPKLIHDEDMKFVEAKLENEQRIIDGVTPDDVYHIDVRGLKTAFALGGFGVNGSELAYQFLNKYPEFDMFAGFNLWRGGEFSFRCIRDDLDTGKDIALPIGGGGHPKASGAPLNEELREEIVSMLIEYMNKAS